MEQSIPIPAHTITIQVSSENKQGTTTEEVNDLVSIFKNQGENSHKTACETHFTLNGKNIDCPASILKAGAHFHLDCNRTNVLDNTNSIGHLS